jgi:diguanylate cyclase (GGDEF)-like protein
MLSVGILFRLLVKSRRIFACPLPSHSWSPTHRAEGDALLTSVANGLSGWLRTSDSAGRMGSDEFALLVPDVDGASAKAYIEYLRHRLLQAMSERPWPLTFSIGLASQARAPANLDGLLGEADSLMYEVIYEGRNRALQKNFAHRDSNK